MDIKEEKLEIMRMVLNTQNPSILQRIKSLLAKEKDFWKTLSDREKDDIMKGIDEIEKGEKYLYDEVMKKHR